MKRALDILVSMVLLGLSLPLTIPICIILKFTGEKRIFFRQERIGLGGKPFQLLKFTTMMDSVANRPDGGLVLDTDPEVFWFGRILRKTKLNEVPQLLNVLRGDMSLVGPRPLTMKSFWRYKPEVQEAISRVRPGLTGIGSIVFRDEAGLIARSNLDRNRCYEEIILPYKGALEQWYTKNASLLTDLQLLAITACVVLFPNVRLHERVFPSLPKPPVSPADTQVAGEKD